MVAERDDLNVGLIVLVGFTSAIILMDVIFGLEAWYNIWRRSEINTKVISQPIEELTANLSKQQTLLHGYNWVDKQKGVVQIPVEEAMKLVTMGKGLYYPPTLPTQAAVPAATGSAAPQESVPSEAQPVSSTVESASPETAQEQAPAQPAPESIAPATLPAATLESSQPETQPEQ